MKAKSNLLYAVAVVGGCLQQSLVVTYAYLSVGYFSSNHNRAQSLFRPSPGYITTYLAAIKRKESSSNSSKSQLDLDDLKQQLIEYLQKRESLQADELAKQNVGKVIGGTKGNFILDYVSGSPNKPTIIEAPSNALDYDELTKYGYSHLVTPIMKAGGRFAMYELLGMEAPAVVSKPKSVSAPKLVIDRQGQNDPGRYKGLKLGQILDDSTMAAALENAVKKAKSGERLTPRIAEEDYVQPFADKRNVGPRMTPDWTPEKLDDWGRQQGQSLAWARKARDGAFVTDPNETLDLSLQQRAFSILTGVLAATAFGQSTPTLLTQILGLDIDSAVVAIPSTLEAPALALLLSAVGSSLYCAVSSKNLNRNSIVWAIKGLLGGPLTVINFRTLDSLKTQSEQDAIDRKSPK